MARGVFVCTGVYRSVQGCTNVYTYDLRFTEIMIYIFHTACIVGRHNST